MLNPPTSRRAPWVRRAALHTAIASGAPTCAHGRIELHKDFLPDPSGGTAVSTSSLPAAARALAVGLPLAVLGAAGVVGGVLWRRRLQRRRLGALSLQRVDGSAVADALGGVRDCAQCRFPLLTRQGRIEALLRSGLVQPEGSASITLVPLDRLPQLLAHHLVSLRRHPPPNSSVGLRRGRQLTGDWLERAALLPGVLGSSGEGGAAAPAGRRWQLPSESMRLPPGELEVCSGSGWG